MRECIWNQAETRPRVLWSGAILVAIGLIAVLFAVEWFAAFDACLANPMCNPPGSAATIEWFLGLMGVGVGITVAGTAISLLGFRNRPIGPTTSKTPYS